MSDKDDVNKETLINNESNHYDIFNNDSDDNMDKQDNNTIKENDDERLEDIDKENEIKAQSLVSSDNDSEHSNEKDKNNNKKYDNNNNNNTDDLKTDENKGMKSFYEDSCCSSFCTCLGYYIRLPKFTIEKIIRCIIVFGGTTFMIMNGLFGIMIVHFRESCITDVLHGKLSFINKYMNEHTVISYTVKLLMSLQIDICLLYTFAIWALYAKNIRYVSSIITYCLVNSVIRFLHMQKKPEESSFIEGHFFSIFVNYQETVRSFYSVVLGIIIISAFEWKRNNNLIMFSIFIYLFLVESFLMISMRGHYIHEIFTAGFMGHYILLINEMILGALFGKNYLLIKRTKRNKEIQTLPTDITDSHKETLTK